MDTIDRLSDQIETQLGIDIWHAYGGGHHFAVEAVVGKIILAIISAFVVSAVDAKGAGERTRHGVQRFLAKLRAGSITEDQATLEATTERKTTAALITSIKPGDDSLRSQAAVETLYALLHDDLGIPEPRARMHAATIAELIRTGLATASGERREP